MAEPVVLINSAFCTPDDVRNVLAKTDRIDSTKDPTLISYINTFSKSAELPKLCNRKFLIGQYIEYYNGRNSVGFCRRKFIVKAPPIAESPAVELWDDVDRVFDPLDKLDLWDDYAVDFNAGIIERVGYPFVGDYNNIKIVYNGGLVKWDQENGILTSPEDLRNACAIQVAHWWRIKNDPGASQISATGGSFTVYEPTQLLPFVWGVLQGYKRHA